MLIIRTNRFRKMFAILAGVTAHFWLMYLVAITTLFTVVYGENSSGNTGPARHRFGYLERSGFEPKEQEAQFREIDLSDRVVYFRQRKIGRGPIQAIVQGEFVAYHFDRGTGRLLDFQLKWHEDRPEVLPKVIDHTTAEIVTTEYITRTIPRTGRQPISTPKVRFSGLYYLSEDSAVAMVWPVPTNPCWIVETEMDGTIQAMIVDAVENRVVGKAVPPPDPEGFSLTGPLNLDSCTGGWTSWYLNARYWFDRIGYPTQAIQYPSQAIMIEKIQSLNTSVFYELAHGGSINFANGCRDTTTASLVTSWLVDIPAMPFTFLASCDGLCNTGPGTLSHAFRKGSKQDTATVGYCGMSNEPCVDSCWYAGYSISWQSRFFDLLSQGKTMQEAFDGANADYPGCGANSCMRFAGDPTLTLLPTIIRGGPPRRIYVDDTATGANTGRNWTDAFISLSDALDVAGNGTEIWVAEGIYPPRSIGLGQGESFYLKGGSRVYGGFLAGATDLEQRDPITHVTILTGDLNGDDTTNLNRSDNSIHVVVIDSCDSTTLLDGCVVTGGNADGSTDEDQYGGGMYCINSTVVINNCTIQGNTCKEMGGGIYIGSDAAPRLEGCRIQNNQSGMLGGGMVSYGASVLQNCHFEENQAQIGGGLWGIFASVTGCWFRNNRVDLDGGGGYFTGELTVDRCLFYANVAGNTGGGIFAKDSVVTISQCTLTRNDAQRCGGLYNEGGKIYVLNSILWNNFDASTCLYCAQIDGLPRPVLEFCCLKGWTVLEGGLGNFDADPLFADPQAGDVHVQSVAGRWDAAMEYWVIDSQTSRCIDAGSPGMIIGDETSMNGMEAMNKRINLGVYGGTVEASRTPVGWSLLADINNDGLVGMEDFAILSKWWMRTLIEPVHADFNRDAVMGMEDLVVLVESWIDRTLWRTD